MVNIGSDVHDVAVGGPERVDRTDKVAEKIARRILRDIVARELPRGAKLPPETKMLQRYEVGRASLREALRILEVYGVIWIKPGPGGGPVVARVDSLDFGRSSTFFFHSVGATIGELVEARLCIEPVTARLAAAQLTEKSAQRLRAVLDHEETTLDETRPLAPSRTDLFHSLIAGMSGNRVIGLVSQSVIDIFIERVHPAFPPEQRKQLHKIHEGIAEAIFSGDGARAEILMRKHVEAIVAGVSERFPHAFGEIIDWR